MVTASGFGSRPGLGSALAASTSGMQAASGRLAADAHAIATQGPGVDSIVDLDVQTATYAALAKVIRATDELTRATVDLLA